MEKKVAENRIYPAIFHKEEDGQYSVEFPDLGCATCGETLEQAFKMAKEALALWLDDCEPVEPTPLEKVVTEGEDRVLLVEADSDDNIVYLKKSVVASAIEAGLEKKQFTKYQVAQILGVDKGYISRISNGQRVPTPDLAKRIGILLDFDWRVFYDNTSAI